MSLPTTAPFMTTLAHVSSLLPLLSVRTMSSMLTRNTKPPADSATPESNEDGLCRRCRYMTVGQGSEELWSEAGFLHAALYTFHIKTNVFSVTTFTIIGSSSTQPRCTSIKLLGTLRNNYLHLAKYPRKACTCSSAFASELRRGSTDHPPRYALLSNV